MLYRVFWVPPRRQPVAVGGRNIEIFGPYGRWGGRKIGYSQPIRFRLSPLFRRHDGQRIGGSPHFSKRTKTRSPVRRGIVADAGATREGRPGRGLIRCGSFSIARSRQNGLGSIPLSCVTRSVDRLTDKGHVEDLSPVRGAPVCRSLKAGALTGSEYHGGGRVDAEGKAILLMVRELEISDSRDWRTAGRYLGPGRVGGFARRG